VRKAAQPLQGKVREAPEEILQDCQGLVLLEDFGGSGKSSLL
jgi:16S rRNA G966 N2-methylase RsmD